MTKRTLSEFATQVREITDTQVDTFGFCSMAACQRNYRLRYGGRAGEREVLRVWNIWDAVDLVSDDTGFSCVSHLEPDWDIWALQTAQHEHPEWLANASLSPNYSY